MEKSPGGMDKKAFSRIGIAGAGLAILGIIIFLILWIVLGNLGVDNFPRLITSLCIPPAVIAVLIGIYMLVARPGAPK
jgi:lipopolysaccharide export LptBFGC system permease protein LptF